MLMKFIPMDRIDMLVKFVNHIEGDSSLVVSVLLIVWAIIYILQAFLAFGTAYRCTKCGNDNGVGLFIYLIGFGFAALIPGLGLHYYIKYLPPKIIIKQAPQPQVIRVVQPPQTPQDVTIQTEMQQDRSNGSQNRQYVSQQGQQYGVNQQNYGNQQPRGSCQSDDYS